MTEDRRLRELRSYGVLDNTNEPGLDALVRLAARVCDVPVALITFIDSDREWFKARVGTELTGVERRAALCRVVLTERETVVVPDMTADPRFVDHPLVTGPLGVRFYAGAPLTSPNGEVVGTVCLVDMEPRELSSGQREALHDVARGVMALLEERRKVIAAVDAEIEAEGRTGLRAELLRSFVEQVPVGWIETTLEGRIVDANAEFSRLLGRPHDDLVGLPTADLFAPGTGAVAQKQREDLVDGRFDTLRTSRTLQHRDGSRVPVVVTSSVVRDSSGAPVGLRSFLLDDTAGNQARADLAAAHSELERRAGVLSDLLDTVDVGLLACDADGKLTLWNHTFRRMLSHSGHEWDPNDFAPGAQTVLHDETGQRRLTPEELPLLRALHGQGVVQQEIVSLAADGTRRVLRASARQVRAPRTGQVVGAVAAFTDITADTAQRQALAASEQRFRAGFHSSPIGMALLDENGTFLEVNDSIAATFGYPPDAFVGTSIEDYMLAPDLAAMRVQLGSLEPAAPGWAAERRFVTADGRVVSGKVSVVRVTYGDGPAVMLGQFEDLTSQRVAEQQLAAAALTDTLTDLPNRVLFTDRAGQALERAHRRLKPIAVMFCDLDNFKLVNDGLGHARGDAVLRAAAHRISGAVRGEDTVARLGGDEFVVLCEDADEDVASRLARRIERAFRQPLPIGEDEVLVTLSIGVSVYDPEAASEQPAAASTVTVEDLLHDADLAMYRAKNLGKNRHTVFDAALRAEVVRRSSTEDLLRRRLATDDVEVHYQPVTDLRTGTVVGVEALCRLRDDDGSFISPGAFIDVAETAGLIDALGSAVLRTAARQAAVWLRAGHDLHVAVNASGRQTLSRSYATDVLAELAVAGLAPDRLVLELTESILIEATSATRTHLEQLRAAGVGIAIDDFGTQYASLRYVQRLPITALKIDMSFVAGLPAGREERAIVAAVAQLARSLDLACIAEGIETPEQLEHLRELGVLGQGYLLGRPVPAGELDLTSALPTGP